MPQQIRVILADDHAVVRQGIRRFLEEDPAIDVVAEASDGAEAVRLVAEHRPEVAVGSSRVDLQACKLEYSIVSPK